MQLNGNDHVDVPVSSGTLGGCVSKMTVAADYIEKCRSSFPSVIMAIRELMDNMLAPDKERNRPDAVGEPLRVEVFLCQGVRLGGESVQQGESHDQLRLSGNGQPIPADKVEDALNLGHRTYKHQPARAGSVFAPLGRAPAAPRALSSQAGEKIYGLFGHGSFLAVGALAYNAFWHCNHVAPDGTRTRWIALFGQAIVSQNQISHVLLSIPHGVNTEEEWHATCTAPGQLEELELKLDMFTQRKGAKRNGLDLEYWSLYDSVQDLLGVFDEMDHKGETLRLDMLLAAHTAPGRLNLQVNDREMEDILEEESRVYLRDELLNWYMPQNKSFALREHIRAPAAQPPPIIIIQEQEVDWFANPWQAIMEMPETFVHPVQTISQGTPYGVHDFKVMVVETKCTGKDSCSGITCFLDSDRAVWAKPMLPPFLQAFKEDYLKTLSCTAASRKAYQHLLKLLAYEDEAEGVEGGLPSAAQFLQAEDEKREKNKKKNVLFELGGRNVLAVCMVDRRFIIQNSLLLDSKDGLADTKVIRDMHVLVLRHCAREVWQRYLWGTGVQPGLGEQSVRSEVVSTALRSLIKEEGAGCSGTPKKRSRELEKLLRNCAASDVILNEPRKRCQPKLEPDLEDTHTAGRIAPHALAGPSSTQGPGTAHTHPWCAQAVGPGVAPTAAAAPAYLQGSTKPGPSMPRVGARHACGLKEVQQAQKALAAIKKAYKATDRAPEEQAEDRIRRLWSKLNRISKKLM